MHNKIIENCMCCRTLTDIEELSHILGYSMKNKKYLHFAMCTVKIDKDTDGSNRQNYSNSALSTLGDTLLKFIISDYLFGLGHDRGEMSKLKAALENNDVIDIVSTKLNLRQYAFNHKYTATNAPKEEQLPSSKHDIYLEAIIGAIYLDRGMRYTKKWVNDILYPLLKESLK